MATQHARNMEIPIELLKAINRWRTEASSETGNPLFDMPNVYFLFGIHSSDCFVIFIGTLTLGTPVVPGVFWEFI
jgi:hypothetical protein